MFGLFGNNPSAPPPKPTNTPTPALPGQQSAPQASAPRSAPQSGQQPAPRDPHNPAPAANAAPTPGQQQVNLADLIMGQRDQQDMNPERAAADYANQFISALTSEGMGVATDMSAQPVQIDPNQLFQAFQNVDMTSNLDIQGMLENLNGEEGPQKFGEMMQQVQLNTIMAMTPLMNQMMQAATERIMQGAVAKSDHSMLSSAIVTEFASRYAYASSPVVSRMLEGFANTIAQSVPRGTPVGPIVERLNEVFTGLSVSTGGGSAHRQNPHIPQSAETDFSGLFTNKR